MVPSIVTESQLGHNSGVSVSRTSSLKNKPFKAGSLKSAYDLVVKAQKGNGWRREIKTCSNFEDGTRQSRVIPTTELDSIHGVDDRLDSVRFEFVNLVDIDRMEIVQLEIRGSQSILTMVVSAPTIVRRNQIEEAFVSNLRLELLSEADANELRWPIIKRLSDSDSPIAAPKPTAPALETLIGRPALASPEKVTIAWLVQHVPVPLWIAFAGILVAAFSLGFSAGRNHWVTKTIDDFTSGSTSPNSPSSSETPRLPASAPGSPSSESPSPPR